MARRGGAARGAGERRGAPRAARRRRRAPHRASAQAPARRRAIDGAGAGRPLGSAAPRAAALTAAVLGDRAVEVDGR